MMSAELRNETSNLPMVWSIFAGGPDDWTPETPMDFRAPAEVPDGVYTVVNHSHMGAENAQKTVLIDGHTVGVGEAHGLEIMGGHFVPAPTARACFKALCISEGINHEPPRPPHTLTIRSSFFTEDLTMTPFKDRPQPTRLESRPRRPRRKRRTGRHVHHLRPGLVPDGEHVSDHIFIEALIYKDGNWQRNAFERVMSTSMFINLEEAQLWATRADRFLADWNEQGL